MVYAGGVMSAKALFFYAQTELRYQDLQRAKEWAENGRKTAREPGAHGRPSATDQFSETAIERSERHILENRQAAAKWLRKRARKLVQSVTNCNGFRWLQSVVN